MCRIIHKSQNRQKTDTIEGDSPMTKMEQELLTIIRQDENPQEALNISIEIIISFLMQS